MTILKKGCRGDSVATLQRMLSLIPDGIFGPVTEEAVKAFQTSRSLAADGIVGPKTWEALGILPQPHRRHIDRIILHCSATPEGKDYTVEQIRQMHLARNFSDVGYHFVIYRDGSVHRGRHESQVGAHTTGYNATSVGVCYIGGCDASKRLPNGQLAPKDTRTPAQKTALVALVRELRSRYPSATVHGHNEFANKACPSFNVQNEPELCGR